MKWEITTPSGVKLPKPVEADVGDIYLQGLPSRGYKLIPYEQE